MKIDLHCHTKAVKKGESKSRNISAQDFVSKVNSAEVGMIAITNHNEFDLTSFKEFKEVVRNDFILLPGIELDVKGLHDERGHVIIIYDDNRVDEFDDFIKEMLKNSNPNEVLISLEDLIKFTNKIECLIIAHYFKPDQLHFDSISVLKNGIKNNYRFFYEPGNFRTLGIMLNHNLRALKGTDNLQWDNYELQDFAVLKLEVDSFKQFMHLLKRDEKIINTLLSKLNSYKIDISYSSNCKEFVNIYNGVNVLFGTKGTGKSVSLERVSKYFLEKSFKVSNYSPDKNQKKILDKLTVSSDEKTMSYYGLDNCHENFKYINSWRDEFITVLNEYFNYVKCKGKNRNKEKMLIVKINSQLLLNEEEYKISKNELTDITSMVKLLGNINMDRHLETNEISNLNSTLNTLIESIKNKFIDSIIDNLAVRIANKSVDLLKNIVEIKTETKTMPSSSGLIKFLKNRYKLEMNINSIISGFTFSSTYNPDFVGYLEEYKKLDMKTTVSMLNDNSTSKDGFIGITNLKEIKKILLLIKNSVLNLYVEGLDKYKEYYESNEKLSLDFFIGVKKNFEINGVDYIPSVGEATMIVLNESLSLNYDVYILDEPEKSLGNNFISDVLLNKIINLGKSKKTIVIATHNANIAVLSFPYKSILKVYNNGNYITYVGSPFTNKLNNIMDENDERSWKDESIRILEGGKEVFTLRGEIYE